MIYLDTHLLIYLVENRGAEHASIRTAMAERAEARYAISALSVMECLVGVFRRADDSLRRRYQFFLDPMTLLPMGLSVHEEAARLRADHRLSTPDALHLAAAMGGGCDSIWTNDDRLSRAAGGLARVVGR